MGCKYVNMLINGFKGGLSGRMTKQFKKCFRVIFSLKKENYPISAFVQSLFSTKNSSKVHKQGKWLLQFSKLLSGSYVSL